MSDDDLATIFLVGNGRRFTATFTADDAVTGPNPAGLADPSTVKFKVHHGDGTEETFTYPVGVTRVSLGVYTIDVVADTPGPWRVEVDGTGNVDAAAVRTFRARASHFAA